MAVNIPIPQLTAADTPGKVRQLQSYLIQLAELLNYVLNTEDNGKSNGQCVENKNTSGETISFLGLKNRFNTIYLAQDNFNKYELSTDQRIKNLEYPKQEVIFSDGTWNEGEEVLDNSIPIKNGGIFKAVTSDEETLLCISDGQKIVGTATVYGGSGALSVGITATQLKYQTDVDLSGYLSMLGYNSEGKCEMAELSSNNGVWSLVAINLATVSSGAISGYAICLSSDDVQLGEVIYSTAMFDFSSEYLWLKTRVVGWQCDSTNIGALTGTQTVTVINLLSGIAPINGTVINYADDSITTFLAEITAEYTGETTILTLDCAKKLKHFYNGGHEAPQLFSIKQFSVIA